MGIFDTIKSAIFGSAKATEAGPSASIATSASAGTDTSQPASGTPAAAEAGAGSAMEQVDVEAVLTDLATNKKEKLDWRRSIVDLMKLLDLDSSLAARKALASELKYSGNMSDSAAMNVWLHKQVMSKLAASGGKVPEDLKT